MTTFWIVKCGGSYLQSWLPVLLTVRQTRAHRFLDYENALGAAELAGKSRPDRGFRPVLVRERRAALFTSAERKP